MLSVLLTGPILLPVHTQRPPSLCSASVVNVPLDAGVCWQSGQSQVPSCSPGRVAVPWALPWQSPQGGKLQEAFQNHHLRCFEFTPRDADLFFPFPQGFCWKMPQEGAKPKATPNPLELAGSLLIPATGRERLFLSLHLLEQSSSDVLL